MFIKILRNPALVLRHMDVMYALFFTLTALLLYLIDVLCSISTKSLYYMSYLYW